MRQRIGVLFVLLIFALTPVSAQMQTGSAQAQPMRTVDGATIFRNYCASCHGLDAQGNGPAAVALNVKPPDLTRLAQRNGGNFPAIHVRTMITFGQDDLTQAHGSKEMPIWGPVFHEIEFDRDMGNVRLENLTKYLESIQKK